MQFQQIRYFIAVHQTRSFSRAARRCAVSQPSLTNGILSLERELGAPLFLRKPVGLSALGEIVRPYFERIARDLADAKAAARRYSPPDRAAHSPSRLDDDAPHAFDAARSNADGGRHDERRIAEQVQTYVDR